MGTINFQFHIMPDELCSFLKSIAIEHELVLVFERYTPPKVTTELVSTEIASNWRRLERVDVVYIYANELAARAERDPLIVNVGAKRPSELSESQLGGGTKNKTLLASWKSLATKLRKLLPERAYVYSPSTGLYSKKATRFVSLGAATAHRDTNLRLSLIGANEVRLIKSN